MCSDVRYYRQRNHDANRGRVIYGFDLAGQNGRPRPPVFGKASCTFSDKIESLKYMIQNIGVLSMCNIIRRYMLSTVP